MTTTGTSSKDELALSCPRCRATVALGDVGRGNGSVSCEGCQRRFEVSRGVLEVLPDDIPVGSKEDIRAWDDPESGRAEHASNWRSLLSKESEIRHLDHFLEHHVTGHRILEIGGGMCWGSMVLRDNDPSAYIVSTDISVSALARAQEMAVLFGLESSEYMAVDVHRLPFPDDFFDVVFGSECLHHLDDPVRCLREVRRVLRPGGRYLGIGEGAAPGPAIWLMNRTGVRRRMGGAEAERYEMTEALYTVETWQSMFDEAGFRATLDISLDPSYQYQNRAKLAYYSVAQWLPKGFVRRSLPCSLEIEAVA